MVETDLREVAALRRMTPWHSSRGESRVGAGSRRWVGEGGSGTGSGSGEKLVQGLTLKRRVGFWVENYIRIFIDQSKIIFDNKRDVIQTDNGKIFKPLHMGNTPSILSLVKVDWLISLFGHNQRYMNPPACKKENIIVWPSTEC